MTIVYSVTVIAFVCCLILTPFVISMCKKYGLVDVPFPLASTVPFFRDITGLVIPE